MHQPKLIKQLAVCLLFAGLAGCGGKEEKKAALLPDVNYVEVGMRTVPVYTEYVGETYGKADVEIRSRVDGWVTSMHFKEGTFVQQGQLLYVIDDQPIRTRLEAAEARLAETRTMMVKAKADLDRVEPLAEMNALSQRDLDAARAQYDASKSEVSVAEAQVRSARIQLSYTRITAPISGTIGISNALEGDYVSIGNQGKPLNTVSATTEVRVRFPVAEAEYLRLVKKIRADGQAMKNIVNVPIELILGDGTAYTENGRMDLANREVDPATGSLLMQAVFNNQQRIIRPGQFVKVRFKSDEYKDALLVPQQTVAQVQSVYQVFVLGDSNKLAPRMVVPGVRVGSSWIIRDGLKAGEKVAVVGNANINLKTAVNPVQMKWDYDSSIQN
ncbi:MAG TPA: efflux RND transporter periplasmic adaptor subunit [Phnomibacter sp.]|nr:efflux RND transporter periplasmic adaptor subunit [Phnomibacter sp.]